MEPFSAKVLQRHYSTIGIEDVFLEGPPHRFPSEYLKQGGARKTKDENFTSWEIVGTIKSIPADFCVREVFQRDRKIPGLSDEDLQKVRVAELLELDQMPIQRFKVDPPMPQMDGHVAEPKGEGTSRPETSKLEVETIIVAPFISAAVVIRSYLQKVTEGYTETKANGLVSSLNDLQARASCRMQDVISGSNENVSALEDTIWIPPLLMKEDGSSGDASSPMAIRQARGDFHRALKTEYPLLSSASVMKDGTDHWISVKVDDSYEELIPYLLDPQNDIRDLLVFQKKGVQDTRTLCERERKPYSRGNPSDDHPEVVLKLKPSVSKEERKEIHRILSDRCKSFSTSTISDFRLGDGTTTTAITVTWFTSSSGKKRKRPSDSNDTPANAYPHVLAVFKKRQWEHLTAIQKLTQAVRCRQPDIGIAGIKDLHAVTYQFCTFRNMNVRRIENANKQLKKCGMELGNLYRVDWLLNNGDLDGNQFELVIRDLRRVRVEWAEDADAATPRESLVECEESHVRNMVERLRRSGFINFFGEQRVGSAGSTLDVGVRAIDIGRAMLQQDFSLAVELLMIGRSGVDSRESDVAKKVRQTWKECGDPAETLKALGSDNIMTRERIVLKGLNRYGKDRPLEALRCLSHSMRIFWINAYQAFVWNMAASARIQKYGKNAVKGDLYQNIETGEVKIVESDENSVPFSSVVLPLPGHNIRYPENEIGDLYQAILERDSIKFEKAAPVESRAKGTYRSLVVQPLEIKSEMVLSDAVKLSFQLPKGCYATMCLRELMLATGTR